MYDNELKSTGKYGEKTPSQLGGGPLLARPSKLREMAAACNEKTAYLQDLLSKLEETIGGVLRPSYPEKESIEPNQRDAESNSDVCDILRRTLVGFEGIERRINSFIQRSDA